MADVLDLAAWALITVAVAIVAFHAGRGAERDAARAATERRADGPEARSRPLVFTHIRLIGEKESAYDWKAEGQRPQTG